MEIQLAKTAGFCFGVNRAVSLVDEMLREGKKVYTLGPIIHNPQIVENFASRGVQIIGSPQEASGDGVVVIRSHGVGADVYQTIAQKKLAHLDATCPFVLKIHRIVAERSDAGDIILIAGDRNHPEVIGVMGHSQTPTYVFSDANQLEGLADMHPELAYVPVSIVAQTTFHAQEWEKCKKISKKVYTNATIFDTICNATTDRQSEARLISQQVDLMLIVGGRESSNTKKLYDVCRQFAPSYLIEDKSELPVDAVKHARRIGVTAGASTPAGIIEEVISAMSENVNNNQENQEEISFAEALEESLKSMNTQKRVKGVVISVLPNEVQVDIGTKHAGFIPANELTDDPNANISELVKPGDELDLLIMRTNDQEGTVMLSKKRVDAIAGFEKIQKAFEEEAVLEGVVADIVKGGLIVLTNGFRVFVPASQSGLTKDQPLEGLLKQDVRMKIIEVNENRRRAVGSIRAVKNEERKQREDEFWSTVQEGQVFEGTVKSFTSYGAFVDLGGVDGMIHISELSWDRIKHPSEVLSIGDQVEVQVISLDHEKRKISLGYKKAEDNPWVKLQNEYHVGDNVEATVVGLTSFGAFARIFPGADGLIHISQIADRRINTPKDELSIGQKVTAKITELDFEKKRISLSILAVLKEQQGEAVEEPAVASEEEPVVEEVAVETAAPEAVTEE